MPQHLKWFDFEVDKCVIVKNHSVLTTNNNN